MHKWYLNLLLHQKSTTMNTTTLSHLIILSLLLLHFNLFPIASASDPVNAVSYTCNNDGPCKSMDFIDEWPHLQIRVDKIIGQIEGFDNTSLTSQEYMDYYTYPFTSFCDYCLSSFLSYYYNCIYISFQLLTLDSSLLWVINGCVLCNIPQPYGLESSNYILNLMSSRLLSLFMVLTQVSRIAYELCTDRQGEKNSRMLYDQYKKVFEDYINWWN